MRILYIHYTVYSRYSGTFCVHNVNLVCITLCSICCLTDNIIINMHYTIIIQSVFTCSVPSNLLDCQVDILCMARRHFTASIITLSVTLEFYLLCSCNSLAGIRFIKFKACVYSLTIVTPISYRAITVKHVKL